VSWRWLIKGYQSLTNVDYHCYRQHGLQVKKY